MGDYERGDLLNKNKEKESAREEILIRGGAMETLVGTDGWKYLADWIIKIIDTYTKALVDIRQNDINKIMDLRMSIATYRSILDRPQRWVNEKNMEEKRRGK